MTLGVLTAGLLAVGAEGLYQGVTDRTPADITCAELRKSAPSATWLRISGCRVLYGSIAFIHRRGVLQKALKPGGHGTVTEVLFPLVDPADPKVVRIVVASNDQATLDEIATLIDAPATDAAQAVGALYKIAQPLESRPIEGVVRHGLFGSEGRTAAEDMRAPLAADFAILDLGTRPSVVRSALVGGAGLLCLVLFVYVLRAPARSREALAKTAEAVQPPAPPEPLVPHAGPPPVAHPLPTAASHPVPPAALTPKPIGIGHLMLLNVGADATAADIEHAKPLGTRASIEETITALLPGTSFDERGRGHFLRSDYALSFELGSGDEVQTAVVGLQGQPAIVAMRRLLRKTGWRLFAPQQGNFVEPETLGGLMASLPSGPKPDALKVRTESRPIATAWTRTSVAGSRYALLAIALLVCLVLGLSGLFSSRQDEAVASQQQVIDELIAVARANRALHVMTGAFTAPEQLAAPANAVRLGAAALPPFFAAAVRHGYRFEMLGRPASPSDAPNAMLEPAYASYVYSAVPIDEASPALSFAFLSDNSAVYSTFKGVPQASDRLVRAIQ